MSLLSNVFLISAIYQGGFINSDRNTENPSIQEGFFYSEDLKGFTYNKMYQLDLTFAMSITTKTKCFSSPKISEERCQNGLMVVHFPFKV